MRPAGREALAKRFGGNLSRIRRDRGFSQEDLAWRSGFHRTQISLLERGRLPRVETALALAGALGVGLDALFEGITFEPLVLMSGGFRVDAGAGSTPGDGDEDR